VAKVNTDDNPEWAMKYGVQGIPTMLFVRDGQIVDRVVGAQPYPVIKGRIDKMIMPSSLSADVVYLTVDDPHARGAQQCSPRALCT
jgi:thioredoxin-like negative regulator of GroEL